MDLVGLAWVMSVVVGSNKGFIQPAGGGGVQVAGRRQPGSSTCRTVAASKGHMLRSQRHTFNTTETPFDPRHPQTSNTQLLSLDISNMDMARITRRATQKLLVSFSFWDQQNLKNHENMVSLTFQGTRSYGRRTQDRQARFISGGNIWRFPNASMQDAKCHFFGHPCCQIRKVLQFLSGLMSPKIIRYDLRFVVYIFHSISGCPM